LAGQDRLPPYSPLKKTNLMSLNNPILDATLNTISLAEIKVQKGAPPWSHAVVLADHIAGNVICQDAGHINDNHCHNYDEWWVVLEGEIDWVIEGRGEPVRAKAGDFVFRASAGLSPHLPQGRWSLYPPRYGLAGPGPFARTPREEGAD
jgi:hypothetical protein